MLKLPYKSASVLAMVQKIAGGKKEAKTMEEIRTACIEKYGFSSTDVSSSLQALRGRIIDGKVVGNPRVTFIPKEGGGKGGSYYAN